MCFCTETVEPFSRRLGYHFGFVVGAEVLRYAVRLHQVGEHVDGILFTGTLGHVNRPGRRSSGFVLLLYGYLCFVGG